MDFVSRTILISTILIPLLIGLFNRQTRSEIHFFIVFLCFSTIAELLFVVTSYLHINNHVLVNTYSICEFLLLVFMYRDWLQMKMFVKTLNILLVVSIAVFVLLALYHQLDVYNQLLIVSLSILMMALSAIYLVELVTVVDIGDSLFHYPRFWIAVGLLIYSGITVFNFSFLKVFLLTGDKEAGVLFSYLTHYTVFICNLIYSWGILCNVCIKK